MEWNARGFGVFRSGYWDAPIFSPTAGPSRSRIPNRSPAPCTTCSSGSVSQRRPRTALVLLGALTLNGVAAAQTLTDVGVAFVPAGLGAR